MEQQYFTVRTRAFHSQYLHRHSVRVDEDGTVLVWCHIQGCYTDQHSLAPDTERRIRNIARLRHKFSRRSEPSV